MGGEPRLTRSWAQAGSGQGPAHKRAGPALERRERSARMQINLVSGVLEGVPFPHLRPDGGRGCGQGAQVAHGRYGAAHVHIHHLNALRARIQVSAAAAVVAPPAGRKRASLYLLRPQRHPSGSSCTVLQRCNRMVCNVTAKHAHPQHLACSCCVLWKLLLSDHRGGCQDSGSFMPTHKDTCR